MKTNKLKALWMGALILTVCVAVVSPMIKSIPESSAEPRLTMFAGLHGKAGPYLPTVHTPQSACETALPASSLTVPARAKPDFSPYLLLHTTRIENSAEQ